MPGKERASSYELVFGSNILNGPEKVVSIPYGTKDIEVVRIMNGADGRLLVEAKIEDETGKTICKIGNSKVQFLKEGLIEKENGPDGILIVDEDENVIFELRPMDKYRQIKINGIFNVMGWRIEAKDNGLRLDGHGCTDIKFIGNRVSGCRKIFVLSDRSIGFGCS